MRNTTVRSVLFGFTLSGTFHRTRKPSDIGLFLGLSDALRSRSRPLSDGFWQFLAISDDARPTRFSTGPFWPSWWRALSTAFLSTPISAAIARFDFPGLRSMALAAKAEAVKSFSIVPLRVLDIAAISLPKLKTTSVTPKTETRQY